MNVFIIQNGRSSLFMFLTIFLSLMYQTISEDVPRLHPDGKLQAESSFFGQPPPGKKAIIFAPELNTAENGAFCSVFSVDLRELYLVHYRKADLSGGICRLTLSDSGSAPELLPFNSPFLDNDMTLSADGRQLIFRSRRDPQHPDRRGDRFHLWTSRRTPEGWTEAQLLLCGGNQISCGYPSITANGTLYFSAYGPFGPGIYRSVLREGVYGAPQWVTTVFNSNFVHGDLYIRPDESMIIISGKLKSNERGYGGMDLFLLVRQSNDQWSEPVNLGTAVNTTAGENCPQITPDGRYLFFNRYDEQRDTGNIYWIDARILNQREER